ncbi:hypothetical protein TNCV_149161 [Trichonephila clavipes]|nr:hypothetical protein TNCV_149161 [Trichonephila clavipes]
MLVRVHEECELVFRRFREGRESVSDKTCHGRLVTSISDENIGEVRKLFTKDRRLTVHLTADELHINRESVRQIVTQYLRMRKKWEIHTVLPKNAQQGSHRFCSRQYSSSHSQNRQTVPGKIGGGAK